MYQWNTRDVFIGSAYFSSSKFLSHSSYTMSKGLMVSKDMITASLKEILLYQILRDSSNYFVQQNFVVEDMY